MERLRYLKWGEPTVYDRTDIGAKDLSDMLHFLERHGSPFFIMPDFHIAYGAIGAPPPQPLLYFFPGLTYCLDPDDNASLDRMVVEGLEGSQVRYIVIEQERFEGRPLPFRYFPLLERFIFDNFTSVRRFGIFEVFEKAHEAGPP